eukprot:g294.t1
MTLIELEDAIKQQLSALQFDSLEEDLQDASQNDKDIYVADYFDILSGSASGSWIAVYLSTKGTDGTLKDKLKDPAIIAKYGEYAPGTARALIVFFYEYIGVFFTPVTPPTFRTLQYVTSNTPGFDEPSYTAEGNRKTMEALVGENTMLDCTTTCLTPMTDIYSGSQITFVTDRLLEKVRIGFTDFSFSNPENPSLEISEPYTKFHGGINFRLQDVTTCSSSGPGMFPWQTVSSISGPETTLWGGDGYLNIAGNAAYQSFAYAANRTGIASVEKYAILSLGTGNGVAPYMEALGGLGPMAFAQSAASFGILLFWGGNDFSNQLDLLYAANPKTGLNQYLRVQVIHPTGTPEGDALAELDKIEDLPKLQKIGEDLAKTYSAPIHDFVANYIFTKA